VFHDRKPTIPKKDTFEIFFHFNNTPPQENCHLYLFYANDKTSIHLKYSFGFSNTIAQGICHFHI